MVYNGILIKNVCVRAETSCGFSQDPTMNRTHADLC